MGFLWTEEVTSLEGNTEKASLDYADRYNQKRNQNVS